MNKRLLIFSVICLYLIGAVVRYIRLDWDQDHYLHPDERLYVNASSLHMPQSWNEFLSPASPLNPHMFYYGSLPLYIYVGLYTLLPPPTQATVSLLTFSRAISSTWSSLTIFAAFSLAIIFLTPRYALIATALFAWSVGSIMYAHYNTTESMLTLIITVMTVLSLHYFIRNQHGKRVWHLALMMGVLFGVAIATKVTGLSFSMVPGAAMVLSLIGRWPRAGGKKVLISQFIGNGLLFVCVGALIAFIGAPYNIIDFPSFSKEQEFMQGVILGKYKPPFTIIYEHTPAYLYQLLRIFPWIFTPTALLMAVGGWMFIWRIIVVSFLRFMRHHKHKQTKAALWFIVLLWPTVYFFTAGAWYAKFTRYMVPLLPFCSLFAAFALSQVPNRPLRRVLIVIVLCIQAAYMITFSHAVYGFGHTRITASEWMFQHIPDGSTIAAEHWDDGLPVPLPDGPRERYQYEELTVYDPDTPEKIQTLLEKVARSDYVTFSSRRVFYSIQRNADIFPQTSAFYTLLFAEKLGYTLVHHEMRILWPLPPINDDIADESFQSYDHPPVFIFHNEQKLSSQELMERIVKIAPTYPEKTTL